MADENARDNRRAHLDDEQFAAWQDGELSAAGRAHLESCPQCTKHLRAMQDAIAAYREYDEARHAALPPPPQDWAPLDRLIADHAKRRATVQRRWWSMAALAAAAALVVGVYLREGPARRASELLEQSARIEQPQDRVLAITLDGRTLLRPAVLAAESDDGAPAMAPLRRMFQAARYSWRDPLSARSFQSWRSALRRRSDSVTAVEESGRKVSYRVRTAASDGILRSAALTLRAADLRAVGASFDFVGQAPLEMNETSVPVAPAPAAEVPPAPVETPVTPEDALRVLSALDALGVAADEPVSVAMDAARGRIVVRTSGLSDARRRQIETTLTILPHVAIEAAAVARSAAPSATERYSSTIPAAMRRRLEERLGGPAAVQEATDRALDASALALAEAGRLHELAGLFPGEVEARFDTRNRAILHGLEERRRKNLLTLVARVHTTLAPVLPAPVSLAPDNESGRTWQAAAPDWLEAVRKLDRLVNGLLAGSYTESSGEEMIRQLSTQISILEHILARPTRNVQ